MTLKELRQFIKLCRDQGVQSIRYEGVELHLGEMPQKPTKIMRPNAQAAKDSIAAGIFDPAPGVQSVEQGKVETDELTPEQLLEWSIQGPVGMDPQ